MPITHEYIVGGMLRVGPEHHDFGDDYNFSVTYDIIGDWAVIKGFYFKNPTPSDFEDVIRAINTITGRLVSYERAGEPPILVYQIPPGQINGRIKLVTHKHRDANEAKKTDGSVDQTIVLVHALEAVIAALKGEITLSNIASSPDGHNPKVMHYSFSAELNH